MKRIERFDKYLKFKGLNDNKVTKQLKLSVGVIGKSRNEGRDLSDRLVEQILNFYTDLSRVWLLTGEGEMLKSTETPKAAPQLSAKAEGLFDKLIASMEAAMASMQTTIETQKQIIDTQRAEIERLQRTLVEREADCLSNSKSQPCL